MYNSWVAVACNVAVSYQRYGKVQGCDFSTHTHTYIYVINEDHNFRRERKPCVSFGPWYNTEISECAGRARKSIRVHPLTFPAGWDAFRAQPLDNKT